jgi:ADP-heptose:LPS heptosyltransferase
VKRSRQILFACLDLIGNTLFRVLGRRRDDGTPPPRSVRRVLVVQWDHLGDAVITTAMLPALRAAYPSASIDVLAAPWNSEVFAARRDIARIHLSRWNRFRRDYGALLWPLAVVYWAWKLRSYGYDLAIDVRGDSTIALTIWSAGIPHRVGWDCAGAGFLLTQSVPFVRGRPEVQSRTAILRTLGIEPKEPIAPDWRPTPDARRFVTELLGEFRRARRLLVLHVGAGTTAKRWPIEHWRELLGRAVVELDARVILVGGPGEMPIAEEITERRYWPNVMDWTGRLSVDQLAALAARASVYVGADSGPAHVAAAVGAKVVVLFSGTNDLPQWRPHGAHVVPLSHTVGLVCTPCYRTKCPLAGHPCMSGLTPTTVMKAIASALGEYPLVPEPHFVDLPARKPGERS